MAARTWNPYAAADLVTSDLLPACPDCGDLAFPGATVCEGCGAHLLPQPGNGTPSLSRRSHCTCGDNGICTHCVLEGLDADVAA